ncbi:MAG: flagellar hook-associated protein FlgK [bacterium]|nr:flagellar hook-associated protein FlgK [bacterium]
MVSLFSSLNIASNALSVNESAISVVSHNVANMNTEGYSKQKVNLATRNIAGTIGNNVEAQVRSNGGVMIANIMRYNNDYLNNYYRSQISVQKQYEQQLDNLGDLADIFDDLDGEGIDAALASFYEALNNLNEYPASSTARINFIETAKTMAATLNSKYTQLDQLSEKALGDGESQEALENSKIYSYIGTFNDKLSELAEVNKALQVTQTGTLTANNLLDKRDKILNEIAEYVDINVEERQNGSVTLYVGDTALVKGSVVTGELSIQTAKAYCESHVPPISYPEEWVDADGKKREAAVLNIVQKDGNSETVIYDNANSIFTGGNLGGLLHSGDLNADGMNVGLAREGLDKLAQTLADLMNDLNIRPGAYCINPDDTGKLMETNPTNYIFVNNNGGREGITAGNIQVNSSLLTDDGYWDIACAYFDDPNNFDERAVGNAQNVVDMLGTRNKKVDALNGMSLEDFYSGIVGKVAAGGGNMQNLLDTQNDIVDSIENQIKSNNSVDLNEELVDLVKYQTAYAASAQVFNAVNSCLDTLMSLGG